MGTALVVPGPGQSGRLAKLTVTSEGRFAPWTEFSRPDTT